MYLPYPILSLVFAAPFFPFFFTLIHHLPGGAQMAPSAAFGLTALVCLLARVHFRHQALREAAVACRTTR